MNRRQFLSVLSAAAISARVARAADAPATVAFRTITYNVLACKGYPETDANRQVLEAARDTLPEAIAKALAGFEPTVVTLQESPTEDRVARMAKTLGMNYAYFPGGFPGTLITPYAIEEPVNRPTAGDPHPKELFTRHLGRARLVTPFGPLHIVSTHFHPREHSVRMREAAAIIALIDQLKQSAPVMLQGDLNHGPDAPEYALWEKSGLVDFSKALGIGVEPTCPCVNPRKRIDYVWATPDFAEHAVSARVLNEPPFTPESSNAQSFALSDHMPVTALFEVPRT